ncbi:MAG: hypothetical protein KGM24_13965, partial [Elusimicrobia bacterium]|nr:hypothetical protein [Elusimicrobiota bacterium]
RAAAPAPAAPAAWDPPVVGVSALAGRGIDELGRILDAHWALLKESGEGRERLKRQHATELKFWIQRHVVRDALKAIDGPALEDLLAHKTDPATLGRRLLKR